MEMYTDPTHPMYATLAAAAVPGSAMGGAAAGEAVHVAQPVAQPELAPVQMYYPDHQDAQMQMQMQMQQVQVQEPVYVIHITQTNLYVILLCIVLMCLID